MANWKVFCMVVIILQLAVSAIPPGSVQTASALLDVADKAVGLAQKVDGIISAKLDAKFNAVSQKPKDLINGEAVDAIKNSMGKSKEITFEKLRGYQGVDEFQPSGWRYEERPSGETTQQEGESEKPEAYPYGAGYMMMSGCFGRDYKPGDPCYSALRFVTRCDSQIDSANFIGVGFDITKTYSAESRKRSVIQRTCVNKATFLGKDVPDNMNAFGIYDYSISTRSFQSADRYRKYLADKSGATMTSGVFRQESRSFKGAQSAGVAGLFVDIGGGVGYGDSSTSKSGLKQSKSLQNQFERDSSSSSTSFLAVLEADLKLYEIALDHSSPDDLSQALLTEFMQLPTSYYAIGADIKLQDFILRYGTHFVKTAKFGGRLNIFKTSKVESKMSQDKFATAAQSEFQSMMSTLKNSYFQTHVKVKVFGIGAQSETKSQNAKSAKKERTGSNQQSTQGGSQVNKRSEFIETTVDAKGGDPVIAAAIMDFYTPAFKGLFIKWLASIPEYPQPYEMSFGKITELFDVNAASLFKQGDPNSGCFGDLESDKGGRYFIQKKEITTANNDTVTTQEKIYCKYGKSKETFMEDFKARRLALERAVAIYIAEGPFSVSTFELEAGSRGCETETLNYLTDSLKQSHSWPVWQNMKRLTFKVLFQLPFDLPILKRDSEFEVRWSDGLWFTDVPGGRFVIDNACPSAPGLSKEYRVCVAGLNLVYEEKHGYFKFDQAFYSTQQTYDANVTRGLGNRFVARAEAENVMQRLKENTIGEVPCNVKWSNAHRIDPNKESSCIHFTAASKGDIFLVFSSIPSDYSTWLYLQMTPKGIGFYRAMRLEKINNVRSTGTLGDASLFETFFVCLTQVAGKDISIMYGKAPAQREVGQVLAAFIYPHSSSDKVSFYTFGSGERTAMIDDVRVITEKPDLSCAGGLIKVGGLCGLKCHDECNGCHEAHDHRSCTSCKNVKHFYAKDKKFECLSKCPAGFEKTGNLCLACRAGRYKRAAGNDLCLKCTKGNYQEKKGQTKCDQCLKGYYQPKDGATSCWPCPTGQFQSKEGQWKCKKCKNGTYQDSTGQEKCLECKIGRRCPTEGLSRGIKCLANEFNAEEGKTECQKCKTNTRSIAGAASCGSTCKAGTYLVGNDCKPCLIGRYTEASGMKECKKCQAGYTSNSKRTGCQDVNECTRKRGAPRGGCAHICTNTVGSFTCSCRPGFKLNSDKSQCSDIDECAKKTHDCQEGCKNTIGSFRCTCTTPGFQLSSDQKTCRDKNECEYNKGGCSHICTNSHGSFACTCRDGYTLDTNKQTCSDINECSTGKSSCSGSCLNKPGTYECQCNKGYELKTDYKSCQDVDECAINNGGCSHLCIDRMGSYICKCFATYTLGSDGKTCLNGDERCMFRAGSGDAKVEDNPYVTRHRGKQCIDYCIRSRTVYDGTLINGVGLDQNGGCWCKGGMSSINRGSIGFQSCFLNQAGFKGDERCTLVVGTGEGSSKEKVGVQKSIDCIDVCFAKRYTDNSINGVNVQVDGKGCWCVKGMTNIAKQYKSSMSCYLDAKNPCLSKNGGCSHKCVNKVGSYKCKCPLGMKLKKDGKTCGYMWYKIYNQRNSGPLFAGTKDIGSGKNVRKVASVATDRSNKGDKALWQLIRKPTFISYYRDYYIIYNKYYGGPLTAARLNRYTQAGVLPNVDRRTAFGNDAQWEIDGYGEYLKFRICNRAAKGGLYPRVDSHLAMVSGQACNLPKTSEWYWEMEPVAFVE